MHHTLLSLFASGLAYTYSSTLAVPSVLTHFTSLFGMVRGGTTLYRHLLLSVFISNERSSSNSGRVRSTGISFLSSIFGSLEAFLALDIAHFLRSIICLSIVLESKNSVFHVKKEAHSPVNVSTSYVLGVYFVGSRHPF